MMKTDAYQRLRNVAIKVNMPEPKNGSARGIRNSTKASRGGTFGWMYDQGYDAKRLERLVGETTEYTAGKFGTSPPY